MKAWAIVAAGEPLQCIEVATPEPQGSEVLIEVTDCGVCHSDLHFWKGSYDMGGGKVMKLADRGVTLPRAPGHEIAGRVAKLGPEATGVTVGQKVVVYPWLGCGECEQCRAENDPLCLAQKSLGIVRHGGFSSHVVVPHPRYLVDIGALDSAVASTFACSGITVYNAVRKAMPLAPDEPIVLIGAGGLGLSAIAMLKAFGHRAIVSVDLDPAKREAALAAGATAAVDGGRSDALDALREAAGGPVRAVIDFVNNAKTVQLGFDVLTKGGRLVLVGVAGGDFPLSLAGMIFRGLSIHSVLTGNVGDLREVTELAKAGKYRPGDVTRMPKDQANEAMLRLKRGEIVGRAVLTG